MHKLNLEPELAQLFDGLHKSSTQRKIKRAERERLRVEEGSSEELLNQFYDLLVLTRRRHRVPPQPRKWFSSLRTGFGNQLNIQIALSKDVPIAGIVTICLKESLVYKYGASNEKYFNLGGMQMLFWHAITVAKMEGLKEVDLGRSAFQDQGLKTFKDRLGAASTDLTYFRYPVASGENSVSTGDLQSRQKLAARLPQGLMSTMGRLLYRHFG
ncbi:MAG TPA: GNAT family N-acetyltransferase [Terriglobales bacterium]|nr:GNAT family N-acetyltransferase [Terriglobales bacterium]